MTEDEKLGLQEIIKAIEIVVSSLKENSFLGEQVAPHLHVGVSASPRRQVLEHLTQAVTLLELNGVFDYIPVEVPKT